MSGNVVALKSGSGSRPSVDRLVKLVSSDMQRVNTLILSKTGSEVQMIPEVAKHLIDSGGKRLRPMLTLATPFP